MHFQSVSVLKMSEFLYTLQNVVCDLGLYCLLRSFQMPSVYMVSIPECTIRCLSQIIFGRSAFLSLSIYFISG